MGNKVLENEQRQLAILAIMQKQLTAIDPQAHEIIWNLRHLFRILNPTNAMYKGLLKETEFW